MKSFYRYILCVAALAGTLPLYAQSQLVKTLPELARSSKTMARSTSALSAASMQKYLTLRAENARLDRENAYLREALARQNVIQRRVFAHTQRAIFRALPSGKGPVNSFTGTVFQLRYQGKKEIYGVIAAHTLQDAISSEALLSKHFTALVVKDGTSVTIPAEVVQVSSPGMTDLALVKFRPEDEALFDPVELSPQGLSVPMQVYSQGYACNLLSKQAFEVTDITSTGIGKGRIPAARQGDRAGFCGSPLMNEQDELVGIHIGSSYETSTGYMAPVSRLRQLVTNYHDAQATPVHIQLAGREIAQLTSNDYVTRIEFLDEAENVLWHQNMNLKFSLRKAEEEIARRADVAFIRLTLGNVHWAQEGYASFLESDEYYPDQIITRWQPYPIDPESK